MSIISSIFPHSTEIPWQGQIELVFKAVPAKWVVYLLTDEQDQPIQLLCVRNLRVSLKNRLASQVEAGQSRRVDYRQIARRVYWQRVDSSFEADLVYFSAARLLYPQSYQQLLGLEPAWFVHIDPEAPHPRFVRTRELSVSAGMLIGPIQDKPSAAKLIEILQDCFDLCRYHNILVQSPHGNACAYKEMGKCPAPCDGSIPMDEYRRMIKQSIEAISDPQPFVQLRTSAMNQAAAGLQFELAARHKAAALLAGQLGKGPLAHARPLERFRFLSLQPGPRRGTAKVFLITPQGVELAACLVEGNASADVLDYLKARLALAWQSPCSLDPQQIVALAAHHLFSAKQAQGIFLPVDQLDQQSLDAALRTLGKQDPPPPESDEEGVVKQSAPAGEAEEGPCR